MSPLLSLLGCGGQTLPRPLLSQGSPGTQCPPPGTVEPGPPPPQGLTALGACSAPPSHTPGATEYPGGTELPSRHSWSPAGLQAGAGARAASGSTAGQQTLQTKLHGHWSLAGHLLATSWPPLATYWPLTSNILTRAISHSLSIYWTLKDHLLATYILPTYWSLTGLSLASYWPPTNHIMTMPWPHTRFSWPPTGNFLASYLLSWPPIVHLLAYLSRHQAISWPNTSHTVHLLICWLSTRHNLATFLQLHILLATC